MLLTVENIINNMLNSRTKWRRTWHTTIVADHIWNSEITSFIDSFGLDIISNHDTQKNYCMILKKPDKSYRQQISLVPMGFYKKSIMYYGCFFHELMHLVGFELGLTDAFQNAKSDFHYGFEEMVAELGSLMLLEYFHVLTHEHMSYQLSYVREYRPRGTPLSIFTKAYEQAYNRFKVVIFDLKSLSPNKGIAQ